MSYKADFEPVYFNFGDLGYPGWVPITKLEMRIVWQGAEEMIRDYLEQDVIEMVSRTKLRLLKEAIASQVTPEWFSTALMCTAIEGQVLGKLPDYKLPER